MTEQTQNVQLLESNEPCANIEPGLLSVFRLILAVMGSLQLVSLGYFLSQFWFNIPTPRIPISPWIFVLNAAGLFALLLYLYSDHLRQWLQASFLPVAILLYMVGSILQRYGYLSYLIHNNELMQITSRGRPNFTVQDSAWSMLLSLMVPLVIVAWQYDFKRVLGYILLTFLIEVPVLLFFYDSQMGSIGDNLLFASVVRTIIFMAVGYILTQMIGAQRQQRRELALANNKLREHAATLEQLTISRERNQMARELHDTLAHSLSAVSVQLEAVDSVFESSPGEARHLLRKALVQTRSGLAETRRALQSLRASPLDDLGLKLALETVAHSVAKRSGMKLQLHLDDVGELAEQSEQNIYRVAQEAMTNALLHAQAKALSVSLQRTNGNVLLTVSDDGRGFDLTNLTLVDRYGLRGMKERAELIGGQLEIESGVGKGTIVTLSVSSETG
ncbi:MAG: sensor histidine kinase [Caldilineaceae bacterium]